MKVLITGATGLVGSAIVAHCKKHDVKVHYLTTSKDKLELEEDYKGFYWNPKLNEIDKNCFEGVDAIINLAGSSISNRWTTNYKKKIIDSRIQSLRLLKTTIEKEQIQIDRLISASAVGIYSDSLTNYYEEDSQVYSLNFLGEVVKKWETEADTFSKLGIQVAKIRIGLVLAEKEGALPKLVQPIKLGFGAALGNGDQWQSWIHKEDLARIFLFVLENKLDGVFNAVAPNPVINQELTKAIAKTINRPLILPNIPKFFLKLLLGEMHQLLLESQRVGSNKLEAEGFEFNYPNLLPTLENLLDS